MSKAAKKARRKAEREAIVAAEPDFAQPVKKQHIWRPGHDPNDPDAYEGSGWDYIRLVPTDSDPRNKTNKHTLGGGPESGFPCPNCGDMTRIVDSYGADELLEQVFTFTPEQRAQIKDKKVYILVCPKCGNMIQFRAEFLEPMRQRWLAKQEETK